MSRPRNMQDPFRGGTHCRGAIHATSHARAIPGECIFVHSAARLTRRGVFRIVSLLVSHVEKNPLGKRRILAGSPTSQGVKLGEGVRRPSGAAPETLAPSSV